MNALFFILSPFLFFFMPNYERLYEVGYQEATDYLHVNQQLIEHVWSDNPADISTALPIVFPEIIRYSYMIDYFQESAMSIVYVHYGSGKGDFSIGRLQMKPTFAEDVEQYVKVFNMQIKYSALLSNSKNMQRQRELRINRLKNDSLQFVYLKAFCEIMQRRFANYEWKSQEEKIKFFATAYNCGLKADYPTIIIWSEKIYYPYGKYSINNSSNYGDIAVYFYVKDFSKLQFAQTFNLSK